MMSDDNSSIAQSAIAMAAARHLLVWVLPAVVVIAALAFFILKGEPGASAIAPAPTDYSISDMRRKLSGLSKPQVSDLLGNPSSVADHEDGSSSYIYDMTSPSGSVKPFKMHNEAGAATDLFVQFDSSGQETGVSAF